MTLQELKTSPQNTECVQVCGYSHYLHVVCILNIPRLHSYKLPQLFHLESGHDDELLVELS